MTSFWFFWLCFSFFLLSFAAEEAKASESRRVLNFLSSMRLSVKEAPWVMLWRFISGYFDWGVYSRPWKLLKCSNFLALKLNIEFDFLILEADPSFFTKALCWEKEFLRFFLAILLLDRLVEPWLRIFFTESPPSWLEPWDLMFCLLFYAWFLFL